MQQKEQYAKIRKKYKQLPDWGWIDKNFSIKEDDGPILDQVRKSIADKLDIIARSMIEPIISGGNNFCCFFERKMLSGAEKEEMFEYYKTLQSLLWQSNAIGVEFSEKDAAKWIANAKKDFEKMKPRLLNISGKLSNGWRNYKSSNVETMYHG